MKKNIFAVFFALGILFFLIKPAAAWIDCPYGRRNDPFPGKCSLYLDTNKNEICDHSEPTTKNSSSVLGQATSGKATDGQKSLIFWPIFITAAIYFCHWYLVFKTSLGKRIKWLNQIFFRFLWNLILLLSFIVVCISGFLLIFENKNASLVFLHNQSGLVFTTVGLIHFLGRINYFKIKL